MLDWNGNGRIDPTDVGVSLAAEQSAQAERPRRSKPPGCLGCLTALLALLAILCLIGGIIL